MKKFLPLVFALALVSGVMWAFTTYASPLFFVVEESTATATSTLVYMSPGAATTTLTYDSWKYNTTNRRFESAKTGTSDAILFIQYTASSTVSTTTLNFRVEYSNDGVDWYPLGVETTAVATTTPVTRFEEYRLTLQNSTSGINDDYLGSGTATRLHQAVMFDEIPTRYVRVKFYVPAGSVNGALWAEIAPRKEQ